ncbi:MAG: hypothetical protein ACJ8G7_15465, partial [Rhizobacter sp.]
MQPASLQRGGATLAATLVLLFVMTLAAAYANRLHLVELHASTNQLQASQSFEAAEAGLEWAVAMLNEARPVDESCRPAAAATTTFRERHLHRASAAQPFVVAPLQAACVHRDGAWRCHCPAAGDAVAPAAPDGDATPAPSFAVQLAASPRPGLVQLVATGCLGACTEPAARVQTTLGFVPAIATLPAAPLTVRDDVVTDAALALRNADAASGGIALQAGGALLAPHARLGAPPGAPGPTVADHDAALHA